MKTFTTQSANQKAVLFFIATLFTVLTVSATNTPEPAKTVVYESFTATTTQKSVILNWKTLAEFNNNHFEVERSTDMNKFKTVAVVLDGFTTAGTGKRYAFKEDAGSVKNGQAAYYRLKQFDAAGNVSYSEIVKVQNNSVK